MVRTPAFHAGDTGFEVSAPLRSALNGRPPDVQRPVGIIWPLRLMVQDGFSASLRSAQNRGPPDLVRPLKLQMLSSNLAGVTVAIVQRLVHQIVALKIRVLSPLRSGRRRTEVPRTSCAPVVTPGAGMPSGEGGGL